MHRDRWPVQPWLYPLSDLRAQEEAFQWFTGDAVITLLHVRDATEGRWIVLRQSKDGWWVHIPTDED